MTERMLTQRELNRALLARQLLLERQPLTIPRALERIGGIQNQYAPNAYIRLWSCLEGFERDALDRALARKSVVQATLMRGTIHVVSARDFWPFAVGIRRAGRRWWLRVHEPHAERVDLDAANAALRDFVSGTTRSRAEIVEFLRPFDPPRAPDGIAWRGVDVGLVRAPPSGTWAKRRARTRSRSRTTGSAPPPWARARAWSIWRAGTSRDLVLRHATTWPTGLASP